MSVPLPSVAVAVRLASIAAHVEEALEEDAHAYDVTAIRGLLSDADVRTYLAELEALALLPVRRRDRVRLGHEVLLPRRRRARRLGQAPPPPLPAAPARPAGRLRVYSWIGRRPEARAASGNHGETREIVAARSRAEAARLAGVRSPRHLWNLDVVGNEAMIRAAVERAGTVLWKPLDEGLPHVWRAATPAAPPRVEEVE